MALLSFDIWIIMYDNLCYASMQVFLQETKIRSGGILQLLPDSNIYMPLFNIGD